MRAADERERARAITRQIVDRIKNDKAFARQAQDDPVGTLQAAGMPDGAIADFLREEGVEVEVAGYSKCNISCAVQASGCWISGSCWVTL